MTQPAVEAVVPAESRGRRLDEVLAELAPDHSRAFLQKLVRRGRVDLDGKRVVRSNVRVRGGERVRIRLEQPARPRQENDGPPTLFVDDHLIVANKPAGLLTHGAEHLSGPSLADELVARFGRMPMTYGDERPGIVHRLDRDTSGAIVVARTAEALEALKDQFRARSVDKTYVALVHGTPRNGAFEKDERLLVEPGARRVLVVGADRGKDALTKFEVTESLGEFALVTCRPRTGRRHQIRVHLAHEGHPVVADPVYGWPDAELPIARQALHASSLAFDHPETGERMQFDAPLPEDMAAALSSLRAR